MTESRSTRGDERSGRLRNELVQVYTGTLCHFRVGQGSDPERDLRGTRALRPLQLESARKTKGARHR